MKRLSALLLVVLMIAGVITGCGKGGSNDGYTEEGIKKTLVIGTDADINNLDLQKQQDQINNIVLKNTHQTLVFFSNEQTFEPGIARSWEYLNAEGTKIRFYLREDVKFSDGTPLTAEDVKFTYEMALGNESASLLRGLVSVTAVEKYVVDMEIESFHNEFIASLASVPLSIQSKAAYESGMENPYYIGSGPYRFVDWVEGEYCRLEKVENYWGENADHAPEYFGTGVSETIEFRPYIDASARVIALRNGEIDVCINPPINELQQLEEDEDITVYEKTGSRLFYFGFNVEAEPWNNQTLRQAVACAIDRQAVLDAAVNGKGITQTTVLNRGLWGFYDDMEGYIYDVERARKLMAEAGYGSASAENTVISTTLTYASSSPYEQIATVIQANLKQIGIDVTLIKMEDAALKTDCMNGNQELFIWRWNEDSKVDFVYRDLFYTDSASNYYHYADSYADQLTDTVATELDETKRLAAAKELQVYLVDACPQVPLYVANLVIAHNKNLQGEYFYGGGNHLWAHAYIEAE